MRKRYKNRTGIGIISLVVLILCGIVIYKGVGLAEEKEKKALEIERLDSKIMEQQERAKDNNNLRAYVGTKKYIEEIAREKLGLVYPDDIIIKPEDEN